MFNANFFVYKIQKKGDDDSCSCLDPTEAVGHLRTKDWINAHQINKDLIKNAFATLEDLLPPSTDDDGLGSNLSESSITIGENITTRNDVDVVFLGDSITEEWNGWSMGGQRGGRQFDDIAHVFETMFQKGKGGEVEALALGISGDVAPNLLWRIQNGEMPDNLNPKVWWVLIGTNDFGKHKCSEEIVLMGILRVVEEIMHHKPDATIVINGILPRSSRPDGKLVGDDKNNDDDDDKVIDFWPAIQAVNENLQKICEKHDQLEYFDADSIFIKEKRSKKYIPSALMKDRLHPTALGHKIWGEAIVKKLSEILNRDKKER
mmetsp:Transcript_1358/g.2176  ORF Transcript_1358/g.2176 Transcript_1358/m.2176 type:complete len:319 (-) Transcript_1358:378-1334(-)